MTIMIIISIINDSVQSVPSKKLTLSEIYQFLQVKTKSQNNEKMTMTTLFKSTMSFYIAYASYR